MARNMLAEKNPIRRKSNFFPAIDGSTQNNGTIPKKMCRPPAKRHRHTKNDPTGSLLKEKTGTAPKERTMDEKNGNSENEQWTGPRRT